VASPLCKFAQALLIAAPLAAESGEQVLLVVNQNDAASREIGAYYRPRRAVPPGNVCSIRTTSDEEIQWAVYEREIEKPIAECLKKDGLAERILYIVTTLGVPLKVDGGGSRLTSERASVDSELTLLYSKLQGKTYGRAGGIPNPFFSRRDDPFTHRQFPMYLVTRLAAYDVADVKAMIDRSLAARNRGKFVVDAGPGDQGGNAWLRTAAILLPENRVILDDTEKVLYGLHDVIGYASWGSNDLGRKRRLTGFQWLPGAIATEFVSTDGRTFRRPPDTWNIGAGWSDREGGWANSPQSLSADYLHEGATGCSGQVYEPFLQFCPRPDYLLPAYFQGRNLAESYWLSIPALSWMNIVLGDPLCTLGKPGK
jgi:uncharacterized protein (TIGR03790 family)